MNQTEIKQRKKGKAESVDMTSGPLLGKILAFSLPLMATGVLQLLFNVSDTIVAGRLAGETALAAVGGIALYYGALYLLRKRLEKKIHFKIHKQ